jgi:hypothetical protein
LPTGDYVKYPLLECDASSVEVENCSKHCEIYSSTVTMEAVCSSETSLNFYQTTQSFIYEGTALNDLYMLQLCMLDRWDHSDHILLIHLCPEMLPFGTKGHKSFHEDA